MGSHSASPNVAWKRRIWSLGVAARGGQQADARLARRRERADVVVERRVLRLHREAAAAHREDRRRAARRGGRAAQAASAGSAARARRGSRPSSGCSTTSPPTASTRYARALGPRGDDAGERLADEVQRGAVVGRVAAGHARADGGVVGGPAVRLLVVVDGVGVPGAGRGPRSAATRRGSPSSPPRTSTASRRSARTARRPPPTPRAARRRARARASTPIRQITLPPPT